jgi:hypothetical protein
MSGTMPRVYLQRIATINFFRKIKKWRLRKVKQLAHVTQQEEVGLELELTSVLLEPELLCVMLCYL